ncbi:MAG: GNAT family N-acetyltransferase [Methanothrix sp.]|nr:GNAT family N-acetyltransferase [Methanothrix sp.]
MKLRDGLPGAEASGKAPSSILENNDAGIVKMAEINTKMEIQMLLPGNAPISCYPIPDGCHIRNYASEADRQTWARVVRAAEKYHSVIDEALHIQQFKDDVESLALRQFFLCNAAGEEVGTATAWFDSEYRGLRWGRFHWLSIVPEYQGRGLAKPLISYTLNALKSMGHERVRLTTEHLRTQAISIYLKFGFLPDVTKEGHLAVWKGLQKDGMKIDKACIFENGRINSKDFTLF